MEISRRRIELARRGPGGVPALPRSTAERLIAGHGPNYRTFDYVSDAFRNGRTVIGRLAGTDLQLAVQFPATENERLDTLGPDAQLPIRAVPLKWNIIYDRLELQAVV